MKKLELRSFDKGDEHEKNDSSQTKVNSVKGWPRYVSILNVV